MSHICDVVKVQSVPRDGESTWSHGLWVGTDICIGTLFSLKGSVREVTEMKYHVEDDYVLIYPSPEHTTEFVGIVEISMFRDLKRICESIPPPRFPNREVFTPDDWVRAIVTRLWHEGIIRPALSRTQLFGENRQFQIVDGFTEPDLGKE